MRPNRKWIKPIWPPQNLKCMFLHSQTRYERNSKGYTYVFGDQLPIGTHENTMRPNRKWIKPIWRPLTQNARFSTHKPDISEFPTAISMFSGTGFPLGLTRILCDQNRKWKIPIWRLLNLKCMFLHYQTRYQRNARGYVFGDRLSVGTHENTMRPNHKWNIPTWRPPYLKCMFLHSQTRHQQNSNGYTYFQGPASHWDTRAYYSTKTEVDKSKMVACYLEMHVSLLQVEISTKFQRLYLCLRGPAFFWDPREYNATKPEVEKYELQIQTGNTRISAWGNKSQAGD